MTKEDLICNGCGAEYTVKYDEGDILDEAMYCPFCGVELDNYIDEEQMEMNFSSDDE